MFRMNLFQYEINAHLVRKDTIRDYFRTQAGSVMHAYQEKLALLSNPVSLLHGCIKNDGNNSIYLTKDTNKNKNSSYANHVRRRWNIYLIMFSRSVQREICCIL